MGRVTFTQNQIEGVRRQRIKARQQGTGLTTTIQPKTKFKK